MISGGSVAGGGRYDKMIGKFTGQDTPACGFPNRILNESSCCFWKMDMEVPDYKREESISVREEDDKKKGFKGYVTCKGRPSGRRNRS